MTARLNENTQYTDPVTGELLVNGFIYIGENNLDAKLNPITIYSDRDLTTPILNPQRTGDDGRAVNKIWIPGQYSMKVENFENVQKLNDLSAGSDSITGNSILNSVSGTNLIVATAVSTASSLVNNQEYILTAANTNTGAMTLTIDAFPTYPIRKHHDVDMEAGDIEANQTVAVVWNATDSVFELFTNSAVVPLDILHTQTAAGVKTFSDGIISDVTGNLASTTTAIGTFTVSKGADIASAAALTLGTDGNSFDITGTTTITSIDTLGIGAHVTLQFDGILTLTHHATNLILPGADNITTAAGDTAIFYEYATDDWRCINYTRADTLNILTLETAIVSTSGTSVDFTSIPGWAKRITIMFSGVSFATNDIILMRIGDSGGLETSGYAGGSVNITAGTSTSATSSFVLTPTGASAYLLQGSIYLNLLDQPTNHWAMSGIIDQSAGTPLFFTGAGKKALTGALTQISVYGSLGGTFDAGKINISYE